MKHGDFVWVDLSTLELRDARNFYGKVLGWGWNENSGYVNAVYRNEASAGVYEMPEFFQKIKMPSFWMSYIAVDSIEETVVLAENLGAKVELQETNDFGKVALIRGPLGAGFTCYEGSRESGRAEEARMGRWYWNELFVSNFSVVEKFYGELFRWKFQEEGGDEKRRLILNERREVVGSVQEASSAEKGEKEYWAVYFGVKSLAECAEVVKKSGGEVGMGFDNSSGRHQVMYDSQGAAFWVTETSEEGKEDALQKERVKWRSVLGLVLVFSAVFFGMDRLWALLFTL